MRVEENDPCCTEQQRLFEDLSGFHSGAIQRSSKQLPLGNQSMSQVKKKGAHDLLVEEAVAKAQVSGHKTRRLKGLAVECLVAGQTATELDSGQEHCRLCGSQTTLEKSRGSGESEAAQAADRLKCSMGQLQNGSSGNTGPEENGKKL
jgi:hypothetical protein